jgi:hypothetical protein
VDLRDGLLWGSVALGVLAALFGLDRLCLWLEGRGWLYYRKKRPTSSPAGCWVAMHQLLEPGVKHVVQVGQHQRQEEDQGESKARLFANLLAALDANPVNVEKIRLYLGVSRDTGLDWRALYEEALRVHLSVRPEQTGQLPSPDEVAPDE